MTGLLALESDYTPINELVVQIQKAQSADALMAALALVYVGISTMAWLSLPVGEEDVKGKDFIAWVDKYLKTDSAQKYQYAGIDVYAARCAWLHSYGTFASSHRKDEAVRLFGYLDAGSHQIDPLTKPPLVLISIALFINDFFRSIKKFLSEMKNDEPLRLRVESRLNMLCKTYNLA